MRTANPALKPFEQPQKWADLAARSSPAEASKVMTINGTIMATLILLGVTAASAVAGWAIAEQNPQFLSPMWMGGCLASLAVWFAIRRFPRAAAGLSLVYGLAQGAFMGAISWLFEKWIAPGVVFQALLLTFGILLALLVAYRVGLLRVGGVMRKCIFAATGGVMFVYMAVFVLQMLGFQNIPYVHEVFSVTGGTKNPLIGIGFSAFVVILASLNLVLDFQFIEEGARERLPKYMEWYGAFALISSLVWLYIEVLRLLAKIRNSN